ncbi:MAG: hypothetical protein ACYC6W_09290 [Nitrosotalea sp.]
MITAKNLSCGNTEAQFRTSIGRSYYSVFLLTRDKIENKYGEFPEREKGEIHKKVIDRLKELKLIKIASKLDGLRQQRRKADYRLDITVQQPDAENAWKLANNIYGLIQQDL